MSEMRAEAAVDDRRAQRDRVKGALGMVIGRIDHGDVHSIRAAGIAVSIPTCSPSG